ncbi:putative nucleotide-diphospho-sugar transferase [Phaeobacter sp. QD34_3]|nr:MULTISPECIES: putative nucleotide-diphospho-sugar transferase [unclassified Phaeobacter]MDE4134801.1 putative nucleotide-diphospho-sugar transferase [Phaeobacter sp. QD34_3]MDE4138459.1 putative nucleotide-diphospho-sugar transferase [Phaeobacter sp. QD34_24]
MPPTGNQWVLSLESYDTDMVFSQGTFWPRDVHAKRGLVLCCGFFHLRPSQSTFAFLDAVQERMAYDQDDQIAVNHVISGWIEEWKFEDKYEVPFRDTRFFASTSPVRSKGIDRNGREFSISVLPHHSYPRVVKEISDQVVVAHPLSGKTMKEKEEILNELGLWKV